MSASMLIVFRRPPYSNSLARAGLDLALAAAAFDQPVSVLFMGTGVLQLLSDQDTSDLGDRNLGKTLASLPLYGVETLHVDAGSLAAFGMTTACLPGNCEVLDSAAVHALMRQHDHLVGM
jgi:tRNA 2-thiouridine synthesizing protein C